MSYIKWINPDGSRMQCHAPGCENPIQGIGLCSAHATRMYRYGNLDKPVPKMNDCPTPGCDRKKAPRADLCPVCRKVRWRYGISVEKATSLMQAENRHCENPGCSNTEDLHLDHDHRCCPPGKFPTKTRVSCGECVRGWLCRSCNLAEGYLGADPDRILGLLEYLKRHNSVPG